MAVDASSSTRLGCGRDIDRIWDSINNPPDEHEKSCPYCQQARSSLTQLSDLTAAQRAADLADPDLQPSPQVLTRIMAVARAEVRRGRRLPLDEPSPGELVSDLTVSEQTVSAVARRAGDAVPGVEVYRCRVDLITTPVDTRVDEAVDEQGFEESSAPRVDAGQPDHSADMVEDPSSTPDASTMPDSLRMSRPARVALFLQISVSASVSIPRISQEVRRAVIDAVNSEVGMDTVRVEITVRDIYDA